MIMLYAFIFPFILIVTHGVDFIHACIFVKQDQTQFAFTRVAIDSYFVIYGSVSQIHDQHFS